jgi:hypothetical protein
MVTVKYAYTDSLGVMKEDYITLNANVNEDTPTDEFDQIVKPLITKHTKRTDIKIIEPIFE